MESDYYGTDLIRKYKTPRERLLQQQLALTGISLKKEMFGPSPPNLFVGRAGYPSVYVGPLIGADESVNTDLYDDPRKWYGLPIEEIIKYRSSLVRGKKLAHVKRNRDILELQDSVLSSKSVDMEVRFKKAPSMNMFFHSVFQPMGPTAEYENMRLTSNPSIPKKVDSIINEGIKAREGFAELLQAKFDVYYLQKILSAGLLGNLTNRRLVPTRWSITAADKIAADIYIEKMKHFKQINEILLYSNEYLANHFEILLLPGRWEFEQFENWEAGNYYNQKRDWFLEHEYEPFEGRSDYAESEGGGYYAGRYGVTEFLSQIMRKQARVVVVREIKKEYDVPVGVWEIRENVRHAFQKPPLKLHNLDEVKQVLRGRLKNPPELYFQKSRILPQRKLTDFLDTAFLFKKER